MVCFFIGGKTFPSSHKSTTTALEINNSKTTTSEISNTETTTSEKSTKKKKTNKDEKTNETNWKIEYIKYISELCNNEFENNDYCFELHKLDHDDIPELFVFQVSTQEGKNQGSHNVTIVTYHDSKIDDGAKEFFDLFPLYIKENEILMRKYSEDPGVYHYYLYSFENHSLKNKWHTDEYKSQYWIYDEESKEVSEEEYNSFINISAYQEISNDKKLNFEKIQDIINSY